MREPDERHLFDPDEMIAEESAEEYLDFWVGRFVDSPEAREVVEAEGDVGWATAATLEYGLRYLDKSLASMNRADVEEILLDIFPRKVSCEPSDAPAIVAELRAFWRFARRELGYPELAGCVALLESPGLPDELRRELANPANYGMAKSFVMGGRAAGYDTSTQAGLHAYLRAHDEALTRRSTRDELPPRRLRPSADARNARRRKRKAQKRSRRRNR